MTERTRYFELTPNGLETLSYMWELWDGHRELYSPQDLDGRVLRGLKSSGLVHYVFNATDRRFYVDFTERGFAFACGFEVGVSHTPRMKRTRS